MASLPNSSSGHQRIGEWDLRKRLDPSHANVEERVCFHILWRCGRATFVQWRAWFHLWRDLELGNNSAVLFLRCLVIIYIEINLVMEKKLTGLTVSEHSFSIQQPGHILPYLFNDSLCFEGYCSNHLESQWVPFNYLIIQPWNLSII